MSRVWALTSERVQTSRAKHLSFVLWKITTETPVSTSCKPTDVNLSEERPMFSVVPLSIASFQSPREQLQKESGISTERLEKQPTLLHAGPSLSRFGKMEPAARLEALKSLTNLK
jgi:hypothetical protein